MTSEKDKNPDYDCCEDEEFVVRERKVLVAVRKKPTRTQQLVDDLERQEKQQESRSRKRIRDKNDDDDDDDETPFEL